MSQTLCIHHLHGPMAEATLEDPFCRLYVDKGCSGGDGWFEFGTCFVRTPIATLYGLVKSILISMRFRQYLCWPIDRRIRREMQHLLKAREHVNGF